jgi:hypothetical protein
MDDELTLTSGDVPVTVEDCIAVAQANGEGAVRRAYEAVRDGKVPIGEVGAEIERLAGS